MPVTKVALCNMALQEISGNRIIKLSETKEEGVLCNLYYDSIVEEVLRAHPWNCALWYQSLAKVESGDARYMLGNLSKWGYQYALPESPYCLRVLEIPDYPRTPYQVASRYLLCNLSSAFTIKYTRKIEDESHFDPLLVRAIIYRLAAELTDKVTNSRVTRREMLDMYEWQLLRAEGINDLESTPSEPENDDWKTAGRS
jgi:hypothetical protein